MPFSKSRNRNEMEWDLDALRWLWWKAFKRGFQNWVVPGQSVLRPHNGIRHR